MRRDRRLHRGNRTTVPDGHDRSAHDLEPKLKCFVDDIWTRTMAQTMPIDRFVFSKAVRLGTYSSKPPAAIVEERRLMTDSRAFSLSGQRVQYLVIAAKPNSELIDMEMDPLFFDRDKHKINELYYITKPGTCSSLECPIWFSTKLAVKQYSFWTQIRDILRLQ